MDDSKRLGFTQIQKMICYNVIPPHINVSMAIQFAIHMAINQICNKSNSDIIPVNEELLRKFRITSAKKFHEIAY